MNQNSAIKGVSANYIHNSLRLKGEEKGTGPLKPARPEDSAVLEKIAREISQNVTSSSQLLLTTGLGIHKTYQVPVRLPAVLLPGLRVMERLDAAGLPVPKYVIYQATDFITETNNYDAHQAYDCADRMEAYLRRYIDRFHSAVAEKVQLSFKITYPENVRIHVRETVEGIRAKINEIDHLKQMLSQLQDCEQKHSNGSSKFETYAAANAVYSGATGEYPFINELVDGQRAILPIGGGSEKPFFSITSALAEESDIPIIPMLTPLGSRPTYYHYLSAGDPLSIDEYQQAIEQPLNDGPVRRDIMAMHADGATPEALSDIYFPHTL